MQCSDYKYANLFGGTIVGAHTVKDIHKRIRQKYMNQKGTVKHKVF